VKARGLGLSIPLDQFSFHLADGAPGQPVNLAAAPSVDDDPLRWAFWQFRVAGEYIVAACMQRTPAARQTLSTLSIVPLRSEEEQHSDCLAAPATDGSVSSSPGALAP
jgi:4'-phosphopantetheinyl transferase